MIQKVFIIGATGEVGTRLVEQIYYSGDQDPEEHENPTRVVGLASSKKFIFRERGVSVKEGEGFVKRQNGENYQSLDDLVKISEEAGFGESLVFVDVTNSGKEMYYFHRKIMNETEYKIVTANKKPLVMASTEEFQKLTKDVGRYGYRCSVMAGADVVTKLRDLRDLRDGVVTIEGCLSGTLGFVCGEIESGVILSEAVRKAKEQGYTEPDPRDDLRGEDVARKLVILARSYGFDANLNDINLKPFVSKEFLEGTKLEELYQNLKKADEKYVKIFEEAKEKGRRIRYCARVGWFSGNVLEMDVGLRELDQGNALFSTKGRVNKVAIRSDTYTEPYCIEAPGAGLNITAQNIRRDIAALVNNRIISY